MYYSREDLFKLVACWRVDSFPTSLKHDRRTGEKILRKRASRRRTPSRENHYKQIIKAGTIVLWGTRESVHVDVARQKAASVFGKRWQRRGYHLRFVCGPRYPRPQPLPPSSILLSVHSFRSSSFNSLHRPSFHLLRHRRHYPLLPLLCFCFFCPFLSSFFFPLRLFLFIFSVIVVIILLLLFSLVVFSFHLFRHHFIASSVSLLSSLHFFISIFFFILPLSCFCSSFFISIFPFLHLFLSSS